MNFITESNEFTNYGEENWIRFQLCLYSHSLVFKLSPFCAQHVNIPPRHRHKSLGTGGQVPIQNLEWLTLMQNVPKFSNKSSTVAEMGDCLTIIDMNLKMGASQHLCPFPWGELGLHPTQCRLGRGLPPYQMVS